MAEAKVKSQKSTKSTSHTASEPVDTPPVQEAARFSGAEWLAESRRQFGQPAWIVRAALASEPVERLYTHAQMHQLIKAALNAPA